MFGTDGQRRDPNAARDGSIDGMLEAVQKPW